MDSNIIQQIKIHHQILYVDDDVKVRYMLILEVLNNTIIKTYFIQLPMELDFWDENFKYYRIGSN